ncbi:MAG: carboxylesterase family protein [Sphingobacteriales bacterium]|nr:MAG: carboxylesterase family protein [Sphingobacteriales bacterium]
MNRCITLSVFLVLVCCLLPHLALWAQETCTNNRYLSENFTVTRTENIPYGNAPALVYPPYISENSTYNKQLVLDLYLPDADTLTKRPAIVMAFGGAFLVGWKQQPQLVDFCNAMARRGYVVAAIDYRLGFNIANTNSAVRAVYRAAQDLKAAVRFLKHHAVEYGIDTNYVYAGGNSAGGISAVHSAYVSEVERNTNPLLSATFGGGGIFNAWPDLGCTECSGNNLGQSPYNISGSPDLVISLWGAIADLNFIQSPTDPPIISFHGLNDNIVLPDGGAPFSYPVFPTLYGSVSIADRCNTVGVLNELHTFDFGHEVWILPDEALYIQQKTADFLYEFLKPATPEISGPVSACANSIATYSVQPHADHTFCWMIQGGDILTNPANSHTITVQWGEGNGSVSVRKINRNLYESDAANLDVNIILPAVPQNLLIPTAGYIQTTAIWQPVPGVAYEVSYQPTGGDTWTTQYTTLNSINISNLPACTRYEIRVRSYCGDTYSDYAYNSFTTNCIRAKVKVFLEGPFNLSTGNMNTDLLNSGLLPNEQPYNLPPWNYDGSEWIPALPFGAVDWVLIEIRSTSDVSIVTDRAAGILMSNGTVKASDGTDGVLLRNTPNAGSFYLVVRHRNHAPVMSKGPVLLPNAFAYDFTQNPAQVFGPNQLLQLSPSTYVLYAADYEQNGIVNYTDYNLLQPNLGQPQTAYSIYDGNLDGWINLADFELYAKNAGYIGVGLLRY